MDLSDANDTRGGNHTAGGRWLMYFTEPPSNVVAVDAETAKQFWRYRRALPPKINVCCGQVNRGVAVLGDRVFVGTVDAHLLALDARTGEVLWDVEVADYRHRPQHNRSSLGSEGQGDFRDQRRRIRGSWIPGRVRCQDR